MKKIHVNIKKLDKNAVVPRYMTPGAAGFDLHALETTNLWPGRKTLVRTGLSMAVPEGWELQIRPRSGMALKTDTVIPNSPGTIDSDYRGEVMVMMQNMGPEPLMIEAGGRIAQGILNEVAQARFFEVDELDETERGDGGFSSTGVK